MVVRPAWQQVLNKEIKRKSYSKAELKTFAGAEADRITGAEGRGNVSPNCINVLLAAVFIWYQKYSLI